MSKLFFIIFSVNKISTTNNQNVTQPNKLFLPTCQKRPATKITTSPQHRIKKAIYIFPPSTSYTSSAVAKSFFSTTISTKPLNFLPDRKIVPKEMYASSTTTITAKPVATFTPATTKP
eukprot:TCONS_00051685-protein